MIRILFEPIDVENLKDFEDLYGKLQSILNSMYRKDHDEILPSIRTTYPIDELGFPLNPKP